MEVDENPEEIYKRTSEDVKSMVKYAKLDEKSLTNITQAIYYPEIENNNFKLLELNGDLLAFIEKGNVLSLKGGLNEKVVLCTETKTYELKEAEISNSLLLIPELKAAQATSKSPLKVGKDGINRSLDKSLEDDHDDNNANIQRELEHCSVKKIFHDYYECREIQPRYRKLNDLLQLTRYSGPENEHCIDKRLLFTYNQLHDTIQCSRHEFAEGLRKYRCIEIDGYYRLLEYDYEYRVVSLMIGLINENSWEADNINREMTLDSLDGIIPLQIVEELFTLYTTASDCNLGKYKYSEEMVCRIIAQNILQQGLKFHVDEFLVTWQEALPDGMEINENYLKGIGIIDNDAQPPCVRALNELNLSLNLNERLNTLFRTKTKWTLDEITPYINYFETPQQQVITILAKYARSMTINGQRIYVAKHT